MNTTRQIKYIFYISFYGYQIGWELAQPIIYELYDNNKLVMRYVSRYFNLVTCLCFCIGYSLTPTWNLFGHFYNFWKFESCISVKKIPSVFILFINQLQINIFNNNTYIQKFIWIHMRIIIIYKQETSDKAQLLKINKKVGPSTC